MVPFSRLREVPYPIRFAHRHCAETSITTRSTLHLLKSSPEGAEIKIWTQASEIPQNYQGLPNFPGIRGTAARPLALIENSPPGGKHGRAPASSSWPDWLVFTLESKSPPGGKPAKASTSAGRRLRCLLFALASKLLPRGKRAMASTSARRCSQVKNTT